MPAIRSSYYTIKPGFTVDLRKVIAIKHRVPDRLDPLWQKYNGLPPETVELFIPGPENIVIYPDDKTRSLISLYQDLQSKWKEANGP